MGCAHSAAAPTNLDENLNISSVQKRTDSSTFQAECLSSSAASAPEDIATITLRETGLTFSLKPPVASASHSSLDDAPKQKLGRSSRLGNTPKIGPRVLGHQNGPGSPSPFLAAQYAMSVPSSLNLADLGQSVSATPKLGPSVPRGAGVRAVRSDLGLEISVPGSPSPKLVQQKTNSIQSSLDLAQLDLSEPTLDPVPEMMAVEIPSQINVAMTISSKTKSPMMDLASSAPEL